MSKNLRQYRFYLILDNFITVYHLRNLISEDSRFLTDLGGQNISFTFKKNLRPVPAIELFVTNSPHALDLYEQKLQSEIFVECFVLFSRLKI